MKRPAPVKGKESERRGDKLEAEDKIETGLRPSEPGGVSTTDLGIFCHKDPPKYMK